MVFAILLLWVIGLTFAIIGLTVFQRNRNIWIKLVALLGTILGGVFCFLLGLSFTPVNYHRYRWVSSDRNLSNWIDSVVALAIWGLSFLLFRVAGKVTKRSSKPT